MGLTIHYSLKSDAHSPTHARQQVEKLRQAALDPPMAEVGEVVELTGAECDPDIGNKDDEGKRWLLIQARRMLQIGEGYYFATPNHVIAFAAWPGEECEVANLGLATYPSHRDQRWRVDHGPQMWLVLAFFLQNPVQQQPERRRHGEFRPLPLRRDPAAGRGQGDGILDAVKDEGGYWEKRDVKALVETVGRWNSFIAGIVGQFKDQFGGQTIAPLLPNSELRAPGSRGRKGEEVIRQTNLQSTEPSRRGRTS